MNTDLLDVSVVVLCELCALPLKGPTTEDTGLHGELPQSEADGTAVLRNFFSARIYTDEHGFKEEKICERPCSPWQG